MKRSAFTLLELLLANMLIAILLGALLLVISSLGRAQKRMSAARDHDPAALIMNLLRRDLANSENVRLLPNQRGFVLTGHAALDQKSLAPIDRRTRVVYEIRRRASNFCLTREQILLDDPIKPQRFEELVATNVVSLSLSAAGATVINEDELTAEENPALQVPSTFTVRLAFPDRAINQELILR